MIVEKEEVTEFDMSDYLDSDEAIAEYITQVLADGDTKEFLRAISYIARAKGMTEVSKETGLSRASLYKTLEENAKPRFETVIKILKSFGIRLEATYG